MVNLAYIFPGQGAQYVGMGKDLYEKSPLAREIFEKANKILGFRITDICFNGPEEKLNQTENSQLAILTVSIAALQLLNREKPVVKPTIVAGLSLGEYSALVAAGSFSFEDSLTLVKKRAQFMKEASLKNPGKMAAIIGLSRPEVEEVSRLTGSQIANLNSPGQIVISGTDSSIRNALRLAEKKGAKKIIILKVEGPYHSRLMDEAARRLREELDKVKITKPSVPLVANVTASYEDSPERIKLNLTNQLNHKTLWEDSIRLISFRGIKRFLEVGP